ncbi:MAG: tetratricopeptide repeat protein, partial [Phycisphaerales bacterium]|nr:tetratricopeptide repeat protein [Phycisphaerales bacterium]
MPGWHERTRDLQASGDLQVVGLIQEQHPDRCALFQQWHGMTWPVLVDSLNLLGVERVPYAVCLDEAGVVQAINPDPGAFEAFMARPAVSGVAVEVEVPEPPTGTDVGARRRASDLGVLFHGALDGAIEGYRAALDLEPEDATTHFRLGVAMRMRFERDGRTADFTGAIGHWGRALDLDPNQYIWRRRIQQYGPRLDKPYSFYDWVTEARAAIEARGETPVPLRVEPGGAEFAAPMRRGA